MNNAAGVDQLQALIEKIIQISVGFAFVALLIMLIVGGIKFLTSGGDPKQVNSASGTLTWAILGVIFLVLAWLILKLIESFTGAPITNFCIGFPPHCLNK